MGGMHPDVVLFDLDGTLTESGPGIVGSLAYALDAMGLPPVDAVTASRFIGPPLFDSFRDIVELDDVTAEAAVALYREYFTTRGMFENAVYAGVPALRRSLVAGGRRLAVATSKPLPFASPIVARFGLADFFDAVCGPESDELRATKAEVVADALAALQTTAGAHAVMVGDRSHDVVGAHAAGIACIGVAWGYGSREELVEAGADAIVADVEELATLLGVTLAGQLEELEELEEPEEPEPASPSVGEEALA
jgi:phosphoglycolate phosphatase